MEIILSLERMYGLIGYGEADGLSAIRNSKLWDAVLYIEGHYAEELSLADIVAASRLNHTTLTRLLKEETGMTPMQYLMDYRVKFAKKQLAFTEVPLKDIAQSCGFKTMQHFARVFKKQTGLTPADFRKISLQKRRDGFR